MPSEEMSSESKHRRVAVFCGSNHGTHPAYAEGARRLGELLLSCEVGLVYGGGDVGLMGTIADTVLAGGGEVIGVMPQALVDREVAHSGLTEMHVVENMHIRKRMMYDFADAVIAMPGGIGTLDELFEAMTWNQLGYLREPCGLLNVAGYYQPLVDMLERMVDQGFLRRETFEQLYVNSDPAALLSSLLDAVEDGHKWPVVGTKAPA